MIQKRPLILASQSPRRKQLLTEAGFEFKTNALDIDESFPESMPPEEVAPYLAEKKAEAGRHLIHHKEIVLTADSVVIQNGKVFNKPADVNEASEMLHLLAGNQHTVVTGICLLSNEHKIVRAGITRVWLDSMTEAEIDFYINVYKPFDKAGGYGVQEWIGLCKIRKLEGTYPNVMGLPVDLVYESLHEFDFFEF